MKGLWDKVVKSGYFDYVLPMDMLQGTELSAKPSPKMGGNLTGNRD